MEGECVEGCRVKCVKSYEVAEMFARSSLCG